MHSSFLKIHTNYYKTRFKDLITQRDIFQSVDILHVSCVTANIKYYHLIRIRSLHFVFFVVLLRIFVLKFLELCVSSFLELLQIKYNVQFLIIINCRKRPRTLNPQPAACRVQQPMIYHNIGLD